MARTHHSKYAVGKTVTYRLGMPDQDIVDFLNMLVESGENIASVHKAGMRAVMKDRLGQQSEDGEVKEMLKEILSLLRGGGGIAGIPLSAAAETDMLQSEEIKVENQEEIQGALDDLMQF